MRTLKFLFSFLIIVFACIGLLFTSVFIAMQFGWFNVKGSNVLRNNSILLGNTASTTPLAPVATDYSCTANTDTCNWQDTREWAVVAGGLTKDSAILQRVSDETGVSPRLIAAVVVPEQIRFFTSNREVFKRYFEPLKILGSLSKFSLGVSGIKQDTAKATEQNALDTNSEFYPGAAYAPLLAYDNSVSDTDEELYNRLTNEKDHYYSYLYTALFIKEILAQWQKAGYDISNEPEIVATLFNLGFASSQPKINPQMGGAVITVGGSNYSFGELGGLFYKSEELKVLR